MNESWFNRTFSKLEKNSLRGAIFMLIISALGTGIMTLHKFFMKIGIIPGILLLMFICFLFILSSDILIRSLKIAGSVGSLNKLFEKILGKKFKILFDVTFFSYLFLVMVSVVLTISKTFY